MNYSIKSVFLITLFFSQILIAKGLENVLTIEEIFLIDKIETIQTNFKPQLKTRGVGPNIFRENAPRTTIIFSSESIYNESTGSGILIHKDNKGGYIITNYHVISNEDNSSINPLVIVGFCTNSNIDNDKKSFPKVRAEVIGYERDKDLALLRIPPIMVKNISPALLEDDYSKIEIAGNAHAIGNPLKNYCTYSSGNISQIRDNHEWEYDDNYYGLYGQVIQTTATILPGNSGGPLFNDNGKLIGINTFGPQETLNFAVSSNEIKNFLSNIPKLEKTKLNSNCFLRNNPQVIEQDTYIERMFDKDCDGYLEQIEIDYDRDGKADLIRYDLNANTVIDLYVDLEGDDLVYYYDENEDDVIEKKCFDFGADGTRDKCI
jgi:S1-C subfamily serine protease